MRTTTQGRANEALAQWVCLACQSGYKAGALAKMRGVSTRQLRRHCQHTFGRSPQDWLDEQRIIAAGYLLKEFQCVKVVSLDLGFKQVSHFCRQFKSYYGLTPTAFVEVFEKYSRQIVRER